MAIVSMAMSLPQGWRRPALGSASSRASSVTWTHWVCLVKKEVTESMTSEDMNVWQQVAEATNDIVTPANVLDVVGFGACIYGLRNLKSWKGIAAPLPGS